MIEEIEKSMYHLNALLFISKFMLSPPCQLVRRRQFQFQFKNFTFSTG